MFIEIVMKSYFIVIILTLAIMLMLLILLLARYAYFSQQRTNGLDVELCYLRSALELSDISLTKNGLQLLDFAIPRAWSFGVNSRELYHRVRQNLSVLEGEDDPRDIYPQKTQVQVMETEIMEAHSLLDTRGQQQLVIRIWTYRTTALFSQGALRQVKLGRDYIVLVLPSLARSILFGKTGSQGK